MPALINPAASKHGRWMQHGPPEQRLLPVLGSSQQAQMTRDPPTLSKTNKQPGTATWHVSGSKQYERMLTCFFACMCPLYAAHLLLRCFFCSRPLLLLAGLRGLRGLGASACSSWQATRGMTAVQVSGLATIYTPEACFSHTASCPAPAAQPRLLQGTVQPEAQPGRPAPVPAHTVLPAHAPRAAGRQ